MKAVPGGGVMLSSWTCPGEDEQEDAHGNRLGRAVAESSFHHFADYNWDPSLGCPSFVTEPVGDGLQKNSRASADTRRYAKSGPVARPGEVT